MIESLQSAYIAHRHYSYILINNSAFQITKFTIFLSLLFYSFYIHTMIITIITTKNHSSSTPPHENMAFHLHNKNSIIMAFHQQSITMDVE